LFQNDFADNSLLNLFSCEYFTIHMLFKYLLSPQNDITLKHLVSKLESFPISEIDFYLPQLW
jgi:hypothetical protein